jgi:hypothetical protein
MTKQQIGRCCVRLFPRSTHHHSQSEKQQQQHGPGEQARVRLGRYSGYKFSLICRTEKKRSLRRPGALIPNRRADAAQQPNLMPLLLKFIIHERAKA